MDRKVVWTEQAYEDINSICEYISKDSRFYAYSFAEKVMEAGDSLSKLSNRGRIVPELSIDSIRELFVFEYRIIYRVKKDLVEILTVIHARRSIKRQLRQYKERK